MRCPHCNQIHRDNVNYCSITGLTINRDQIEKFAGPPPNPRITVLFATLGIILVVAGILLLVGDWSHVLGGRNIPASRAGLPGHPDVDATANRFPTRLGGSGSPQQSSNPPLTPGIPSTTPPPPPGFTPTAASGSMDLDEWVVYTYGENNDSEIFMLQPSSGETRRLTNNTYADNAPTMLARTNEVIYSSMREEGWQLYLLDLRTHKETQLTHFNGQARFPEWSPESGARKILFEGRQDTSSGKRYSIWLLDLDTGALDDITSGNVDSRPQWSPDGKQVVFGRALSDSNGNGHITTADYLAIHILNLETGQIVHLANSRGLDNFQYVWSPDGEWILFCSVRTDVNGDHAVNLDDSRNLWRIRPDGSDEHELPLDNKNIFSPSWSMNGHYLIYTVHKGEGREEMWLYEFSDQSASLLIDDGPIYHAEFAVH